MNREVLGNKNLRILRRRYMIILVEFVNRRTFEETGARGRYCAIVSVKLLLLDQ
jgi:hypothetical protein